MGTLHVSRLGRSLVVLGLALGWALSASASQGAAEPASDTRPSFVVVLTDDQRQDTLGCTGNELVRTPHIDRLAAEGALFRSAFVVTSLCCPARASLLTGRWPHAHGVTSNASDPDFLARVDSIASWLADAGYETAFIGKYHIAGRRPAATRGFDTWIGFDKRISSPHGEYFDQVLMIDGKPKQTRGYSADALTEIAVDWLRRPRTRPFLLVLSLKNCHSPFEVAPRHEGAVPRREIQPPKVETDRPMLPFVQRIHERGGGRLPLRGGFSENHARYLEAVLAVDDCIGTLDRALAELDLTDRTLLAFLSDGGYMWGEHGLFRKGFAFEPSIRIPLVLRLPGEIPSGFETRALALNVDLAPTLLDLAGVDVPAEVQGRSLRGLWDGTAGGWRADFLYSSPVLPKADGPTHLAVRGERWKYVLFRDHGLEEALFDLDADPDELQPLLGEEHAERRAAMRERLVELVAETGAPASWLEASSDD